MMDSFYMDLHQQRMHKKTPEKDVPGNYFSFMLKVLSDLGVPQAQNLTKEKVDNISEDEVNTYLKSVYGTKIGFNLSAFEKKMIFIALKKEI